MKPFIREKATPVAMLMLAAVIVGAEIGTAAHAHADTRDQIATAVCTALDRNPTIAEVTRIGVAMHSTGVSYEVAGQAIAEAVYGYCPWYTPILDAFITQYAPNNGPQQGEQIA